MTAISLKNNIFIISGDLTFNHVMQVWNDSLLLLKQQTELQFDFSKVEHVDSAGLALVLEWLSYARSTRKNISFHAIPSAMQAMAEVSGVARFFKTHDM